MSMRTKAEWDRHALEIARGVAAIDRSKMKPVQFVDAVHHAIVGAMYVAADGARPAITIRPSELQLNAPGLALTDTECEVLRMIAERMRRVEEARRAEVAPC
ncbi:hypothetical protein BLA13014_04104 [Burkholderia aenigmatica]|uniref:Uncharacterized protein n=1 Tax=Burkholderia aenigmatica TaxID=2015348 RepID=A0A6P2N109_9BURK|nr:MULTISPECIES: response regulator transcription factor [Burkholderia]VWB88651.1 hypothetical protein BLA13014_04104 [Burkholderia aenigmatica]